MSSTQITTQHKNESIDALGLLDQSFDPMSSYENYATVQEFKKGQFIPIVFKASGEIFNVQTTPALLEVTQDIYILMSQEGLLFSKDGQEWTEFTETFTGGLDITWPQVADEKSQAKIHLMANFLY